jgi:CheY-like chemotaxis protein
VFTIVKGHGGFIKVYSEEGNGTEFKVCLPAAETMAIAQSADASREMPIGHGEVILVADDESAIREITKSTLETYGYSVLTAGDGAEAVALFAQHKDEVKLVLTDLRMPYMDGPATIRALKKLDPQIRIIITSGLTAKAIDAASAGASAFLSKPYTADRLLKALANLLSQKPTAPRSRRSFNG